MYILVEKVEKKRPYNFIQEFKRVPRSHTGLFIIKSTAVEYCIMHAELPYINTRPITRRRNLRIGIIHQSYFMLAVFTLYMHASERKRLISYPENAFLNSSHAARIGYSE